MRSLLELFGAPPRQAAETAETATVRKIARRLEALGPARARYVAAFAYVLGRVAHADLEISDEESDTMEELLREQAGLPGEQAALVVEIAKSQNRLFGGTENYLVTRELRHLSSEDQRRQLLHCLFAVSAADDSISGTEEQQIRAIATELGLSDQDYLTVRASYNEKRSVIQRLKRRR